MSDLLLLYLALLGNYFNAHNLLVLSGASGNLILDTTPSSKTSMPMMASMMSHYNPFAVYPSMHIQHQHQAPPPAHFSIQPIYIEDHSAMNANMHHEEEPQHHVRHTHHHESVEYEHHPQHHHEQHHENYPMQYHGEVEHHDEEQHEIEHNNEHQPHHYDEHEQHHAPQHYETDHHQLLSMLMHGAGSQPQVYQQFATPFPIDMTQQSQLMAPFTYPASQPAEEQKAQSSGTQTETSSAHASEQSQQQPTKATHSGSNHNDPSFATTLLNFIRPRSLKKDQKQKHGAQTQ